MIEIGKCSHQNSIEMLRDSAGGGEPVRLTTDQALDLPSGGGAWRVDGTVERVGDSGRENNGDRVECRELFASLGVVQGDLRFYVNEVAGEMYFRSQREYIVGHKLTFGAFVYPLQEGSMMGVVRCNNVITGGGEPVILHDLVPGQWNRVTCQVEHEKGIGMFAPAIVGHMLVALPAMVSGSVEPEDWRYYSLDTESVFIDV